MWMMCYYTSCWLMGSCASVRHNGEWRFSLKNSLPHSIIELMCSIYSCKSKGSLVFLFLFSWMKIPNNKCHCPKVCIITKYNYTLKPLSQYVDIVGRSSWFDFVFYLLSNYFQKILSPKSSTKNWQNKRAMYHWMKKSNIQGQHSGATFRIYSVKCLSFFTWFYGAILWRKFV